MTYERREQSGSAAECTSIVTQAQVEQDKLDHAIPPSTKEYEARRQKNTHAKSPSSISHTIIT